MTRRCGTSKVIEAIVAPRQKRVYIKLGKKLLKVYNFKQDVPFTIEIKQFHGYDYGEWCVSERDYTYEREVKVWDKSVMEEIKVKALNHYKNNYGRQKY